MPSARPRREDPRNRRPRAGDSVVGWALHAAVIGGTVGALVIDRRLRGTRLGRMQAAVPIVSTAFYGLLWAVESRRPYRSDWRPTRHEVRVDGAFLVSLLPAHAVALWAAAPIRRRLGRLPGVDRLPVAAGVALGVLVFDLGHSRLHHLGHRWGPAWRVHSVHHSAERLYWFNATRFHWIEVVVDGVVEAVMIGVLGLNRDQALAYQAVRGLYGQLQHCNIELRSGALDHVVSTPDLHRWHHSTVGREGDANYGAVTSVWDRVFGTCFRPDDRDGPDDIGIGGMAAFPRGFWGLERVPFDWAAIRERNPATALVDRRARPPVPDAH